MLKKRGVLERVLPPRSAKARKKGMKWLVIDGEFYTMFGELPQGLSPGDEVLVQFEEEEGQDGRRYKRLLELEPAKVSESDLELEPQPQHERGGGGSHLRDRLIYRSVCLKAAAGAPFVKSGEEIIALARELERFLYEAAGGAEAMGAGVGAGVATEVEGPF